MKTGIENMKLEHVADVVQLHKVVLPETLNTKLGRDHLVSLYSNILKTPYGAGFIFLDDSEECKGFISATYNIGKLKKKLKRIVRLGTKLKAVLLCLIHPYLLSELLNKIIKKPNLNREKERVCGYILTIGVDRDMRGKGVGGKLIQRVISDLHERKIEKVIVDTKSNNKNAARLYLEQDFYLVDSFMGTSYYAKDIK